MQARATVFASPVFWIVAPLAFLADQVSKTVAGSGAESILGIPVSLAYNSAGPLGSVSFAEPWVLGMLSLLLLVPYFLFQHRYMPGVFAFGAALLVAGPLGNGIDRIVHGEVVDWIPAPGDIVFNLADVFALLGILICLAAIFHRAKKSLLS